MFNTADLDMPRFVADSSEGLSDDDFTKAESSEKSSDDDYMPSVLSQEHASNTWAIPKKQRPKKKQVRKEGEKDKGLVIIDLTDSPQKKVGKNQATKGKSFPRPNLTNNENERVQRTTSLSMAELDRFRFTKGGNVPVIGEAVPLMESEFSSGEGSAQMLDVENVRLSSSAAKSQREECLVIDIDTDEVVELSDDTQFNVLLRLCGEECEQDEFRTDVPDVERVPTLNAETLNSNSILSFQQPKPISTGDGRPNFESVEAVDVTEVNMLSSSLVEAVADELIVEETQFAHMIDYQEAQLPLIEEENNIEEQNSQDCEDMISSMMTQKCVSQPEEVKARCKTSPSPLQNLSNLPASLDTSERRVIQMKSIYQLTNRIDSKDASDLINKKPGSNVHDRQPGEATEASGNHCSNKENVGGSPCGVIAAEHPSDYRNSMECSDVGEDHKPEVEDVIIYSGEVRANIKCPVCGVNISGIPVEERLAHSNSCLDKLDIVHTVQQGSPEEENDRDGHSLGPTSDRVSDWLLKLNLSRYVSLFVEQEIDWDTLPWLTEQDLVVIGISAIGPRRKLVQAIQDLKSGINGFRKEPERVPLASNTTVDKTGTIQIPIAPADAVSRIQQVNAGDCNNLITKYFPLPPNSGNKQLPDKPVTNLVHRTGVVKNKTSKRPRSSVYQNTSGIPAWMCIPGTPFRVDAFQHLSGECSHWFLTHFHTDHYQGLTRGFRYGHIFCSSITARLVNLRIGVSLEKLMIIPLHEKVKIAGVDVTFIDANHCPGSVMILFEPPNGEAVLHTGDFRFCPEMANNPLLQSAKIHTLVLDTTYCEPQYDFPTQETVIRFVIDAIQAEMFNSDTLFLIGTYTIGKERVYLEVAKALKKFVYVGAAKKKLLDCMDLSTDDTKWITSKEYESFIHVVPLWSISSFKRMECIVRHYQSKYKLIVAFSPSGWSFGRGKKKTPGKRWKKGTMIRYEVPYSEHCSFPELKEFLKFIGPEDIIPSVPSQNGVGVEEMISSLWSEDQ